MSTETDPIHEPAKSGVITLNELERAGLDSAVEQMQRAQAVVNALAASRVAVDGYPANSKVEYRDGTLIVSEPE